MRPGQAPRLVTADAAPPLGAHLLSADGHAESTVPFDVGDTLLLSIDGVIEARDACGTF
ncbi:hypothetical protein [Streptomyces sp. NPDC004014]